MQISLSKLYATMAIILSLGIVGYAGYFLFVLIFNGPKPQSSPSINTVSSSVFNANAQKAIAAIVDPKQKISLNKSKDISFTDSALYKSFSDKPEDIPLSSSRGRANPFVPYVAP